MANGLLSFDYLYSLSICIKICNYLEDINKELLTILWCTLLSTHVSPVEVIC